MFFSFLRVGGFWKKYIKEVESQVKYYRCVLFRESICIPCVIILFFLWKKYIKECEPQLKYWVLFSEITRKPCVVVLFLLLPVCFYYIIIFCFFWNTLKNGFLCYEYCSISTFFIDKVFSLKKWSILKKTLFTECNKWVWYCERRFHKKKSYNFHIILAKPFMHI